MVSWIELDALASLDSEHRLIIRAVDALDAYLSRVGSAPSADLGRFARFFREFADDLHHHKEEDVLFPAMLQHGFGWDDEPLAEARAEHEHEVYLLGVLEHAAGQPEGWTAEAIRRILSVGRTYVEFQRNHVATEAERVYRAARRSLSGAALQGLAERLDALDRDFGVERRDKLRALAEELVGLYAPASA